MRDANGQQIAYVYYESEPGRQSAKLSRQSLVDLCDEVL
jgi:hypothetical protein